MRAAGYEPTDSAPPAQTIPGAVTRYSNAHTVQLLGQLQAEVRQITNPPRRSRPRGSPPTTTTPLRTPAQPAFVVGELSPNRAPDLERSIEATSERASEPTYNWMADHADEIRGGSKYDARGGQEAIHPAGPGEPYSARTWQSVSG